MQTFIWVVLLLALVVVTVCNIMTYYYTKKIEKIMKRIIR